MILELLYLTGWITLGILIGVKLNEISKNLEKISNYKPNRSRIVLTEPMIVICHTEYNITNCVGETTTAEVGELWYATTIIVEENGEFVKLIPDVNYGMDEDTQIWLNKENVKDYFYTNMVNKK